VGLNDFRYSFPPPPTPPSRGGEFTVGRYSIAGLDEALTAVSVPLDLGRVGVGVNDSGTHFPLPTPPAKGGELLSSRIHALVWMKR